jgi:hypothetical protein
MANETLKGYAKEQGVKLWEVAEALKVAESTFCKHLRRELPEEQAAQVRGVIDQLHREKGACRV